MLEAQKEGEILNGDIQTQMCKMQRALWKGNVKFVDVYSFTVEGSVEEANVMNEVRQRIKEQGRVWWALEASKGVGWYLQPQLWEGNFVSSLSISTLANTIVLKRLIRQGIPPVFRPNIWFCASGAAKKRSTVPHSYYQDLIQAVQGMVTPATRQIDQMTEDQLLAAQNIGDIINTLHYATHHSFDPDALLKVAFEKIGSMTIYSIRKHRKKRQAAVMAELEQRLKRLNSLENDRLPSSKNVGFK